jgi:hypothetical protein
MLARGVTAGAAGIFGCQPERPKGVPVPCRSQSRWAPIEAAESVEKAILRARKGRPIGVPLLCESLQKSASGVRPKMLLSVAAESSGQGLARRGNPQWAKRRRDLSRSSWNELRYQRRICQGPLSMEDVLDRENRCRQRGSGGSGLGRPRLAADRKRRKAERGR